MFKHILFPTDTSESSNSGFVTAVDLARQYEGKITLLNVHEEFMTKDEMQYLRVSQQDYQEFIRQNAVKSREIMQALIEEHQAGEFCEILLREGKPRKEILEVAGEIDANLIVMSSNGRSNLAEQLIGSVAESIVRHSVIPVMVVKC